MAVDPGTEQSAWLFFDGVRVLAHAIEPNADLVARLSRLAPNVDRVVFEQIESFGMAVGREVFETVFWTGRFYQATSAPVESMTRKTVKVHLCQSARAQDSNIRAALCDRFGGQTAAKGTSKARGPLFGIKSHEWSALAIAVTWHDLNHPSQPRAVGA